MSDFGNLVKTYRKLNGWSVRDLAKHSGVPYTTIYGIEEMGQKARAKTKDKLCTALELDLVAHTMRRVPESGELSLPVGNQPILT